MDNRITKKRLSNFFAYDWILVIVLVIVSCVVWEFFYGVASVKPTTGQHFKIYYDLGIDSRSGADFQTYLDDKNTLSYDVLKADFEGIVDQYEVLTVRLEVQEGDMIITESTPVEEQTSEVKVKTVRSKHIVDRYPVYSLEQLLLDAKTYLSAYLKDGVTGEDATLDFNNFDQEKIKAGFHKRLGKDNRFRTEEQKKVGENLEIERIKQLSKEAKDFAFVLENAPDEIFYRYTKYEQMKDSEDLGSYYVEEYTKAYEEELRLRPNHRYGINLEKLTGGTTNASTYFKKAGESTAKDTVMFAFNFKSWQEDLQYECISVFNAVIRECSDILTNN